MHCASVWEYLHPVKWPSKSFRLIYSQTEVTLVTSAITSTHMASKVEFS